MEAKVLALGAVVVGMAASWFLGYRHRAEKSISYNSKLSQEYFVGLNYLLNEEPDDAIDIFIDSLELNSKTLETYMALGTLLRRRGKVDRSISVYQNLLAWPEATKNVCDEVKVELAISYVAAGLLGRAEGLLIELESANKKIRKLALTQGIIIYRLEKDWLKAIDMSEELLKISNVHEKLEVLKGASHFYCELVEIEIAEENFSKARYLIRQAFQKDRNNVRASLLLGTLEYQCKNYKQAIKSLNKVKEQDQHYFTEAFPLLLLSYQKAGFDKKIEKFIESSLEGSTSSTVLLAIADYQEEKYDKAKASEFLIRKLQEKPSLRMLNRALQLASEGNKANDCLSLFHTTLNDYLLNKALYKCGDCGFDLKKLHWMCPGCSSWGTVKPKQIISQEKLEKNG